MIGRLISGVVGIFSATILFWLGIAYEHRPANPFPNIPVRCCLVVHFNLGNLLPESLGAQLAASRAQLKQAQANEATLEAAISAQNTAIRAAAKMSAAAKAKAESSISLYRSQSTLLARRLAIINRPLPGVYLCARYQAADAQFVASLRQ